MMIDLAARLDALRIAVGKVEALAAAAVESYDNTIWPDAAPLQIDRMAHLLGATADAAATAVAAVDHFRTVVVDQQPSSGEADWTSP
jgi:K+-transporting ATPase c subunit